MDITVVSKVLLSPQVLAQKDISVGKEALLRHHSIVELMNFVQATLATHASILHQSMTCVLPVTIVLLEVHTQLHAPQVLIRLLED